VRRERLILFTRYPVPGQTKSRLIPALGAPGAASLQRRLTLRTLRVADAVCAARGLELEIRFDGGGEIALSHWLGGGRRLCEQGLGDLGARMARAFEASFQEGFAATVIIGSDCPGLTPELLADAFEKLSAKPIVLGPATDGGYYLIGLTRPMPQLFSGPAWGTETVLAVSLRILQRERLEPTLLEQLSDIDRPEDLAIWQRITRKEEANLGRISVVVPSLNEAGHIQATLAAAGQGKPHEILVVDGGSTDDTERLATLAGAIVLRTEPGRARQMNAGAARATGNTLLFLHADTLLPHDFAAPIADQLRRQGVAAGAFRFRVKESFRGKRLLERTTNFRSRWTQMPYGDQGLFLRRALFEELGGFADMPLMEDYELVCRLRRCGRVVTLKSAILTSGRRWQRLGVLRATLINQFIITAYRLGYPIEKLADSYKRSRSNP
jgi:rSAM/selenodomain-associated transferase 2/rSAM/selenodomain-associated transferase 1